MRAGSRRSHRWLWVLIAVTFLLSACSLRHVPREPYKAELLLDVGSTGDASLDVLLGGGAEPPELIEVGARIGEEAFSTASRVSIEIDGNSEGPDFAVLHVDGAYIPGQAPAFDLDTQAALVSLREDGYSDVRVTACLPAVPRSVVLRPSVAQVSDNCWRWRVVGADDAPSILLVMHPESWRAWLVFALYGVTAGAGTTGWLTWLRSQRRRWSARVVTIGCGTVGLGGFLVGAILSPGILGIDNLAISGAVDPFLFRTGSIVVGLVGAGGFLLSIGSVLMGFFDWHRPPRLPPPP